MSRSLRKRARDFLGCYLPLPWYYGREFRKITGFLEHSNSRPGRSWRSTNYSNCESSSTTPHKG